jgi:hypothetical protein
MNELLVISDAIDNLLDRPKWSRKELAFYKMLISKVQEYRSHYDNKVPVKDLSADIREIQNNIESQLWYTKSPNRGTISDLFSTMRIVECKHQGQPGRAGYQYKLDLELKYAIHLVMEVSKSESGYYFRVYYQLHGNKGHIAAYSAGTSSSHMQLPEYDVLARILPNLLRYEIVCLAIELVLYYDVDGIMSTLQLGNNYPVTLPQLVDAIKI